MTKINIPKSHPRYLSLFYRNLIARGVKQGITSLQGLTAHGRGEAFDYLLGEKTQNFALQSIKAAAALLILSKHHVISVNGNTAVLVPKELIKLANIAKAQLEVNLFHPGNMRERKIAAYLQKFGAKDVFLSDDSKIPGLESNRRKINKEGQLKADVIFVPLEDGDRTEYLIKMGKKVITCDLNPLSRTAQKATVTIVDNITRALPQMIKTAREYQKYSKANLWNIINSYDNRLTIQKALLHIKTRLATLSKI